MSASYALHGPVAVITLDNPPVNGLGYETRRGIADGVQRANADAAVKAIVLTGAGKAFSGGADIKEFGSPKGTAEPNLLSLIRLLDNSAKPTVAAINGTAMGGGLELALGCHYRVAVKGAPIALPEVKLGLVPGAGGTQRLPRVLGVETALNMIASGEPVTSELLASQPGQKLFDKIVEAADFMAGALAFANEVADARPLKRVRDMPLAHPNPDAFFQFARNTVKAMAKNFPAPARCVDCVEQAMKLKFDDGMRYEREAFIALMATPESRSLRHAFFAERAASKIADVPDDTPQRAVKKVAVIGAGTMGGGIAMNFLNAGIAVTMLEMKQDALDRGLGTIRKNYEAQVKKGKLKADQVRRPHGAADDDAVLRRHQGRRPRHRSGVRGDGRQGEGLQDARRGDEARRDPGIQHLDARRQQDRGVHQAAAGRGRHAFLQPGQRDEAARSRARREDRPRTCSPP